MNNEMGISMGNHYFITKEIIRQNIDKISERLLEMKPFGSMEYRPYLKNEVFYHNASIGPMCVDLRKLYPEASVGDMAYIGTNLLCVCEYDVMLYVKGNVKVEYEGTVIFDYNQLEGMDEEKFAQVPIHVNKGDNNIVFLCRCTEKQFGMEFISGVDGYQWWARDYIFHSRATSPLDCYRHETGVAISRLYKCEEAFDGCYVYPEIPVENNIIDFHNLFDQLDSGHIAYALTYALDSCVLKIMPHSSLEIYVNDKKTDKTTIALKKTDKILIKSFREEKWGFEFAKNPNIGIPFLKSNRKNGDQWLVIGAFGKEENFNLAYEPENRLIFDHYMFDENWNKIFWRFTDKNTYLRAYMDTCFFAQWFYAVMVGHLGILDVAKLVDDKEKMKYFYTSMQTMAQFFDYARFENAYFGEANFLRLACCLDNLDSIGTMGTNMIEAYKLCPTSELARCIDVLAEAIKNNVPRFEDGTFRRPYNMWADDLYMSTPFLVRLGVMKKEDYYFEECVRQFRGFRKRLYMPDKGIYSHIFFLDDNQANQIPWGRGNGWIFNALSDVCSLMPDRISEKENLLSMFREFAYSLQKYQDEQGLWHQVLNRPDSYAETSASAMFLLGMCRGVNHHWLKREDFKECIDRACYGLLKHTIDQDGNISGVCKGSSCSYNEDYYIKLETINNDDHGTGIVLSALCEYLKFKKDE